MELINIVKKLTGSIEPIGCHTTDKERLANFDKVIDLTSDLLIEICNVEREYSKSHEVSVRKIGLRAEKFLRELAGDLHLDYIESVANEKAIENDLDYRYGDIIVALKSDVGSLHVADWFHCRHIKGNFKKYDGKIENIR